VAAVRQRRLPAEAEDVDVLAIAEPKREEFGLTFTTGGELLGAAKLSYDASTKQTEIAAIVDASCEPIGWMAEGTPAPNPTQVSQYTTLRLDFGDQLYLWDLEPDGGYETELHRFRP
jgi:hypothetical protein